MSYSPLLLLLLATTTVVLGQDDTCDELMCSPEEGFDAALSVGIDVVAFPGAITCGLVPSVSSFLSPGQKCILKGMNSVCGCPEPETPCLLCGSGSERLPMVSEETRIMTTDVDMAKLSTVNAEFPALFGMLTPSCGVLQAYTLGQEDEKCSTMQEILGEICGCGTGGMDKPDETDMDKPDETGMDKPDDTGMDKPDDTGMDKPDDTGMDKPDDTGMDKPDDTGMDKPDDTDMDKEETMKTQNTSSANYCNDGNVPVVLFMILAVIPFLLV